jgi:HSP20 family protein
MAVVRWTPMGHLQSFQDEMNRMFNQFFRGSNAEEGSWGHSTWTPPVDIYETDNALVFQAELPGVAKDEVNIEVHNNTLILRGERKHDATVQEDNYHRVERTYGGFQRVFTLPTAVDADKVQASMKDGVLELHLPKHEAAKPKRIAVQS